AGSPRLPVPPSPRPPYLSVSSVSRLCRSVLSHSQPSPMDLIFWFNVLTRWLHVTSAVVGIGALLFLWLVLLPSVAASGSLEPMVPRLKSVIHAALGLLLLTGFCIYYVAI